MTDTITLPQRKPLTIKEINALPQAQGYWPIGMNDRIVRLIRAVESAHGIKENSTALEQQQAEPVARICTDEEMRHRDPRWGRLVWLAGHSAEQYAGQRLYLSAPPATEPDLTERVAAKLAERGQELLVREVFIDRVHEQRP